MRKKSNVSRIFFHRYQCAVAREHADGIHHRFYLPLTKQGTPMPQSRVAASQRGFVVREFHVSRQSRDRYGFEEQFFAFDSNVIFALLHGSPFLLSVSMRNGMRHYLKRSVSAGDLNAMGLVDEILHYIVEQYRRERSPRVMEAALTYLRERLSRGPLSRSCWLPFSSGSAMRSTRRSCR